MNLTYKEIFLQEKNLQQTLYGKFGYKLDSMNQIVQKKKKNDNYPVTANIKLRKVAPSLYRNQKIEQVEKEIEDLKKDRKRRQQESKASRNNGQDSNKYMEKMQYIINQYNYFIDHKHIKQKGTQEARKMLNIQPKTQAQKAMQEIEVLKDQLLHANIQQQFKLNRKINELYKLFKNKIDQKNTQSIMIGRRRAVSQQVKDHEKNSSSFRVMSRMYQESHRASSIASKFDQHKNNEKNLLNLTQARSHQHNQKSQFYLNASLHEGKLRKIKSHNADDAQFNKKSSLNNEDESKILRKSPQKNLKQILKEKKKNQEAQKSILEPYVSKEFIENGKKMDVKIKNNSEALQLWKGRIAEAVPPQDYSRIKSKRTIQQENNYKRQREEEKIYNRINDTELDLKQHVPYIQNKKIFKHETVQNLKMKNLQQEEILSGLLEKKNCKYLRPWGTKILVKYNASKQAKDMLGLSPSKESKEDLPNQTHSQTGFNNKTKQDKTKKLQLSLSFKENDQNEGLDWDNEIDEQYYWTMCKNEKINLLLKGKRR